MNEIYTTGTWKPNPGSEQAFVDAWKAFAGWASSMSGARTLRLLRDLRDPARYVSFGAWESIDEVKAWKGSPEFKERMAQVLQHVDDFRPAELELVATAEDGAAVSHEEATVA